MGCCITCHGKLEVSVIFRRGLAAKLQLLCKNCAKFDNFWNCSKITYDTEEGKYNVIVEVSLFL